ncbi:hypothetical protein H1Q63_23475 [Desmonostoc muscorum CCALA 125]|nr:hypothetical protein [Desmonostoc muscorum CCALA 125]
MKSKIGKMRSLIKHYQHFSNTLGMRKPWFLNLTVFSNQMRGAIFNTSHSQNLFLSSAAK